MKVIAFIEDHRLIGKIIRCPKPTFMAERPHPHHIAQHELLMEVEERRKNS